MAIVYNRYLKPCKCGHSLERHTLYGLDPNFDVITHMTHIRYANPFYSCRDCYCGDFISCTIQEEKPKMMFIAFRKRSAGRPSVQVREIGQPVQNIRYDASLAAAIVGTSSSLSQLVSMVKATGLNPEQVSIYEGNPAPSYESGAPGSVSHDGYRLVSTSRYAVQLHYQWREGFLV